MTITYTGTAPSADARVLAGGYALAASGGSTIHACADGDLSAYSFHMADQGTDAMEREKAFLFASQEGRFLWHIDEALRRLSSVASSGARCGVYTLMIRDTRIPMPQGSHFDDLHDIHASELRPKPDPHGYELLCERFGIDPKPIGIKHVMDAVVSVTFNRYSFETMNLLRARIDTQDGQAVAHLAGVVVALPQRHEEADAGHQPHPPVQSAGDASTRGGRRRTRPGARGDGRSRALLTRAMLIQ